MGEMEFNILRRAEESIKSGNMLETFCNEHGITIEELKRDPDYHEELIRQYSRTCINQQLFQESKERMETEFSNLCEFYRRNQDHLIDKFYSIAKNLIKMERDEKESV